MSELTSPAPPCAAVALAPHLRAALAAADYTVDSVVGLIGEAGQAGLLRNHTIAASRAIADRDDPLATLTRLFCLRGSVSRAQAEQALPQLVTPLIAAHVLRPAQATSDEDDQIAAGIEIRPYSGDDGVDGWVASDLTVGLDGQANRVADDYVLGLSPASTTLAMLAAREPVGTALDLGTGCGVQALHLSRHAKQVTGTDLNQRALSLAGLTAALNDIELELLAGDLYQPVQDRQFDQIVSNPPYVMSPPDRSRLAYRESSRAGDGLVAEVARGAASHLNPGGTAQLLVNWIRPVGGDWRERVAGWLKPTGCSAHVVEREVLDCAAYVEMWLADAGRLGQADYRESYDEWLSYLEAQAVEAIAMGWIFLYRDELDEPTIELESRSVIECESRSVIECESHSVIECESHSVIECESHYGPVSQPLGSAVSAGPRWRHAARLADDQLAQLHLIKADDLVTESLAIPGATDPFRLRLVQSGGFARRHQVGTALAGVVGACDGELALGAICSAVAELLEVDEAAMTSELMPQLRILLSQGLLIVDPGRG